MTQDAFPNISLLCAGKDVSERLLALTVVREAGRIPFARAVLSLDLAQEKAEFTPGDEGEIKAKIADKTVVCFKGIINSVGFRLRGNVRQLHVEIRDKCHSLTLALRTRLFLDKSDSDICKEICSEHGIATDFPQTGVKHAQIQQACCSDWDFLCSRLRANGLVPLVTDGKISAHAPDKAASSSTLTLNGDDELVTELELRSESRAWLQKATVRAWDAAKQKEFEQSCTADQPSLPGNVKPTGKTELEILFPRMLEKPEAEALAKGMLQQFTLGFLCGRVSLHSYAEASPGDTLQLKNFAGFADGQAIIWASRLEMRPGRCSLDIQFGHDIWEAALRSSPSSAASRQGEAQQLQGLYPGKVLKISEDPEQGERIQVHLPLLHKEGKGVWARLTTLYAGKGRGVIFRPEKDDEVLLGFLGGDPRAPVILGALPSKANAAPDILAAKDEKNSIKGFVSKNGLQLLFNEEDKSISLETPAGQRLRLDDKEGLASLADKNNNTLIMDKNGICLKSGKDIVLDAKGNITIKAAQKLNAEALQAAMDAKQSLTLSGKATAELKADGILTIKGGLVKIN